MLMQFYLDGEFRPAYLDLAAGVRREEYYVRMMAAWYFATALAKQLRRGDPLSGRAASGPLDPQQDHPEGGESFRITPEQKAYLRQLRWRA